MTKHFTLLTTVAATIVILAACGDPTERIIQNAEQTIVADELVADIKVLSADEFEGRSPASRGETKTIEYLTSRFTEIGLQPGNGDSFLQAVPLVEITADRSMALKVAGSRGSATFSFGDQFMGWTKRVVDNVEIERSDMVFVGYGIVAPEFGWNDYDGVDATGKTVVMLVNDPGFATGDDDLFTGNAMTYYGRWTYKYEEAARQGATAAIVIHQTAPAGYPWEVVSGSWSGGQFDLVSKDNNMSRVKIEGWIHNDAAHALFTLAGQDLDALAAAAAQPGFSAVPLGLEASVAFSNSLRQSISNNIMAVLPGTVRPDEYVVYMGHWDHLGLGEALDGDQIYNGALDNASGTSGLLQIAEAFAALPEAPERSVLFLAVAAEEQGLLGSRFYAENPVYPLTKTVAAINMDGVNIWGKMNDITVVGFGNSELDEYLTTAAASQGRVVRPDPEPEKGFYFRSDHFSFGKQGVPALYTDAGIDHVEHGREWAIEQKDKWTSEKYHKPSDEYEDTWDLTGAIDDMRIMFRIGYQLSHEATFPQWREGVAFKAKRDSDMAASN